ncbi:MAG: hypothetical protein JWM92_285 [Candidatus Nomurabacteria bacterium]|nr:hypothetical protein [Candidatus Nomurabacteria bacterium]
MQRILKIILILLAVFFLVLGGVWLLGRHAAQKNGTTPLSFRQFLGLGTKQSTVAPAQGTSATFTSGQPTAGNAGGAGTIGGTNTLGTPDNFQVSKFTSNPLSPADTTTFTNNGSIGGPNAFGGAGNFVATAGAGTTPLGSNGLSGGLNCSATDSAITFTPDEITQLNALQTRYNAIAANLASNDDVATELSTYTSYKLEEAKIAELQNFCAATTPLLSDPEMKRHVPTPFWHDTNQDSETFTAGGVNTTADGTNPASGESFLERILRINLW